MSSREETVRKLGKLSKLALTDEETERFGAQTEKIIGYFQLLKPLDLSGVEPTSHAVDIECYRRPDEPGETLKCLGEKFPYLKHDYFRVPRIIADTADRAEPKHISSPDDQ